MKLKQVKSIIIAAILTVVIFTAACANLLEGHVESVTAHETVPYERPGIEYLSISNLEEFEQLLLELIMTHEAEAKIHYQRIVNADVQAEIMSIVDEIMTANPVVAYAVTNITATATRIVAYYEIDIEIEFRRTEEQIRSIVTASTQRYMMTQLLEIMSQYREEAVILTNMQIEKDEIQSLVAEIYYQNPRRIVMMPFVTVEVFPEEIPIEDYLNSEENDNGENTGEENSDGSGLDAHTGEMPPTDEGIEKIYEIKFGYTDDPEMLQQYAESLDIHVRRNAERAIGETDAKILLSLIENLIAAVEYDEGTAETISEHGAQNFAATAFGALVRGSAVGEGFAMAFKALCDVLRFDNRIVLGFIGDRVHAWNIVALDGHYYHIDAAMCAKEGLSAGFLKRDEDFLDLYIWDMDNSPRCDGLLTLDDIINTEEPGSQGGDLTSNDNGNEED